MAIFKITPATSVLTNVGNAFQGDTSAADTLIVDPSAYLITTVAGDGVFLANTGAWTVTVNGSIVSQNFDGILLDVGNAAVSTIKIGADGEVQGNVDGILVTSSANIINAGQITCLGVPL